MHVANTPLVVLGAVFMVAAIGGKGAEFQGLKIPHFDKLAQQIPVFFIGLLLLLLGLSFTSGTRLPPPPPTTVPTSSTPTVTPTPTETTPPPPTPSCGNELAITSPTSGTVVANGANGVSVGITACGLQPGETGWLFDYDTGDGTYNFDGNSGPIVTSDGDSSFTDRPIGDQGDVHKDTRLTLVLANVACAQTLDTEQSASQSPTNLPTGCQITSQVDVYVTYP
jgi:hypothetical protein